MPLIHLSPLRPSAAAYVVNGAPGHASLITPLSPIARYNLPGEPADRTPCTTLEKPHNSPSSADEASVHPDHDVHPAFRSHHTACPHTLASVPSRDESGGSAVMLILYRPTAQGLTFWRRGASTLSCNHTSPARHFSSWIGAEATLHGMVKQIQ